VRYLAPDGTPALTNAPPAPAANNGFLVFSRDGRLAVIANPGGSDSVLWIGEPGGAFTKVATFAVGVRARGVAFEPSGGAVVVGEAGSTGSIVLLSREE
jgi:hypothetical protein